MIADQIILQQSSKEILKLLEDSKSVPTSLFENWITAFIVTHLKSSNNELDSDTRMLCNYLRAQYTYSDKHGKGFDRGAVYGSMSVLKRYEELIQDSE